jgi:hypothetical protein
MRSNLELQNAYKSPDIVTASRIGRLDWLRHVVTLEDTGIADVELEDPRWADTETLRIKIRGPKPRDRREWVVILREAKATIKGP